MWGRTSISRRPDARTPGDRPVVGGCLLAVHIRGVKVTSFYSDDYRSNVDVAELDGGRYRTAVATHRILFDRSGLPALACVPVGAPDEDVRRLIETIKVRLAAVAALVETADRQPLGLPCDGMTFDDPDAATALGTLLMLSALGYYVTDAAVTILSEKAWA